MSRWVKIAIVGSRAFGDCDTVFAKLVEVLKELNLSFEDILLVSGGAKGVDRCAEFIAREVLKVPFLVFPANWDKFGRSAGPIRNSYIAEVADVVIAFPSGESKGTWDTINKAKLRGKKVYVFSC